MLVFWYSEAVGFPDFFISKNNGNLPKTLQNLPDATASPEFPFVKISRQFLTPQLRRCIIINTAK